MSKWKESLANHERDFRASMPKHIAMGLEAVKKIVAEESIAGYYGPVVDNFTLRNAKYRTPVEVSRHAKVNI